MDPTTAFVMALLALLVSLGSAVLGIYNLRHQSRRDFPKARWKTTWANEDDGVIRFTFENEGTGDAREMELWVFAGADGQESWIRYERYGTLPYGQGDSVGFGGDKRVVRVQLRWRHGAKLHKLRTLEAKGRRR